MSRWAEEEVIWAYLLSRAPMNKDYPLRNNGTAIYKWGKYNYEKVASELSMAKRIGNIESVERDASKIDSNQNSKRAYMKDLSDTIKNHRVKRDTVLSIS